jgi:hypothetical protein
MSEREIVIRLRIPAAPKKSWLVAGGLAIVCISALAYAASLTVFKSGDALSSAAINGNFNYVMPVTGKVTYNALALPAQSTPLTVTGSTHQVTVMPSGGKGVFVATLTGQWDLTTAGAIGLAIVDVSSTATSGSVMNNGACNGNTAALTTTGYYSPALTWVEAVNDASPTAHTFGVQYSASGAANLYGDLNVIWFPQP